jgi:hypothetical protein
MFPMSWAPAPSCVENECWRSIADAALSYWAVRLNAAEYDWWAKFMADLVLGPEVT